jgi:hypothetical protein
MGLKVAMLRYTPVEIYEACKPPAMLEFHDPNSLDWLQKEVLLVRPPTPPSLYSPKGFKFSYM